MTRPDRNENRVSPVSTGADRLATTAFVCGVLGLVLLLLSYLWIPFALLGIEVGSVAVESALAYIIVAGEAGGLLAGLAGIVFGVIVREHLQSGTKAHRLASRGLAMGIVALVLIVGLNVLGTMLSL